MTIEQDRATEELASELYRRAEAKDPRDVTVVIGEEPFCWPACVVFDDIPPCLEGGTNIFVLEPELLDFDQWPHPSDLTWRIKIQEPEGT